MLNSVTLMFFFIHKSTIKVLRCQLPRENKFYKPTPPSEDDPEVRTYHTSLHMLVNIQKSFNLNFVNFLRMKFYPM